MKATEDNFIHLIKRRDERGILYVVDQYGGVISAVVKKGLFCLPNMEEECTSDGSECAKGAFAVGITGRNR